MDAAGRQVTGPESPEAAGSTGICPHTLGSKEPAGASTPAVCQNHRATPPGTPEIQR